MNSARHILQATVRKYDRRVALDKGDREALANLQFEQRTVEPNRHLVRDGDRPGVVNLILDGIAFRHRITPEGSRQILSVHIAGELVDVEGMLLARADHNVQALSPCTVAAVPRDAFMALVDGHPRIARAMWIDTLIDASIYREWIVNVGRRDSRAALCHLLCEYARRREAAGLADPAGHELPMTQEQLADALGITPVHVNRLLRDLDRDGLIVRDRRLVRVPDRDALRKIGGFSERYLHLDQYPAPAAP